jgi:hypothetical protein
MEAHSRRTKIKLANGQAESEERDPSTPTKPSWFFKDSIFLNTKGFE